MDSALAPGTPEPAPPEPVGRFGLIAALGALAGLGALAAAIVLSAPLRAQVANIRGEGEVAKIAGERSAAGERTAPAARREDSVAAVRADLEPLRRRFEADFGPPGRESPTLSHGLARLERWSELKVAWAAALARAGLSADEYAAAARRDPHPMDALLLPRSATR